MGQESKAGGVDDVGESGQRGDPRLKPRISIAAGDRVFAASGRVGVAGAEVRLARWRSRDGGT